MSHLAISEPDVQISPEPARNLRNPIYFSIAAASGCLLFVVSRKLTWGVDEPLLSVGLWTLAIAPYLLSVLFAQRVSSEDKLSWLVQPNGFVSVWTSSLALYVLARATGAASLIDDQIYDAYGLSIRAFSFLSVLYVGVAYAIIQLTMVGRRSLKKDRISSAEKTTSDEVLALTPPVCILLFFALVFFVPLQH